MAFLSIPDSWIQVGQAVVQRLWQRTKDNFDSLLGQIGTLQGADILNGFFEIVIDIGASPLRPLNWTVIEYLGGTVELDNTSSSKGTYALKCNHPGGAGNGGGEATSDYHPINQIHSNNKLQTVYWSTQAGVHLQIKVDYFTAAKLFISSETVLDLSGGVPTSKTLNAWTLTVPATARFMKAILVGGATDIDPGSSTDIFFDSVSLAALVPGSVYREAMVNYDGANTYTVLNNATEETTASTSYVKLKEILVTRDGIIDTSFQLKKTGAGSAFGKIYLNGSPVGTERNTTSTGYVTFTEDIAVSAGDLLQLYSKKSAAATSAEVSNFKIRDGQPYAELSTVSS